MAFILFSLMNTRFPLVYLERNVVAYSCVNDWCDTIINFSQDTTKDYSRKICKSFGVCTNSNEYERIMIYIWYIKVFNH
ncbi:MAG: hypothetical protein LBG80_16270 [Bacteroidales bacterium]|nr:hypothetical protein [Bacteroidales bacterium]